MAEEKDNHDQKARMAVSWFEAGHHVIPIIKGTKVPAVKRDPFLEGQSKETIVQHWDRYPDNDLAIILSEDIIILDADSEKSLQALDSIEFAHGITSNLIVTTKRGEHRYYRLKPGVYAPSSTHDSEKHPERIDVLGAKRQVIVPPSTDKSFKNSGIKNPDDLVCVDQAFVDSVFLINSQEAPRRPAPQEASPSERQHHDVPISKLETLLEHLDPDCGYEDWTRICMAIYHETTGSDEGFDLFDQWSSESDKYPGISTIKSKWQSMRENVENPITIGTLINMAKDQGVDICNILDLEDFPIFETKVIEQQKTEDTAIATPINPLLKHSLTGQSEELSKICEQEKPILGTIALSGQMSVWYAAPNTGKTLLTLSLLTESIRTKKINPSNVYYLNMDDTHNGLVQKLKLAEEYGFEMLAPGYSDFKAEDFLILINKMVSNGSALGTVIILDTLKKFVDLMNKKESSKFAGALRNFVLRGGTVISLAHTNKNKVDNKSRYAGTSDIVDDSDCVYIIDTISEQSESGLKVIEFTNEKRRSNVPDNIAYCYDSQNSTDYIERLLSVELYDGDKLPELKRAEEKKADSEIIDVIKDQIKQGTNTKMDLAVEAGKQAGISRKTAISIIEKYTGSDPEQHIWTYSVRERGKHIFFLLDGETPA